MSANRFDSTQECLVDAIIQGPAAEECPEPGLVLIWMAGQPLHVLLPLGPEPRELGRGQGVLAECPDAMMSRRHAQVAYRDGQFEVTDLRSRNGSAINGVPLSGMARVPARTLVRLGHSLFLCCEDLRPHRQFGVKVDAHRVEGPALQQTLLTVSHVGQASRTLFISGESGVGKESVARAFQQADPQRDGPFVAVNCAAIPEGVAERLLFGARKGAFSGATSDSEGYIEAADGGTLFLDEVADLDMVVQGKLLRVIESGELLPLGATRPRKVKFRVCSATHKDLRGLVEESRFRADLYFRIGMPQVSVPPLRQRAEELPWLLHKAVQAVTPGLQVDLSLVEACLQRDWPGNIRELQAEITTAALAARAASKTHMGVEQLRPDAGQAMQRQPSVPASPALSPAPPPTSTPDAAPHKEPSPAAEPPSRAQILAALIECKGNVSAAARAMRVHRTQLQRLLVRYGIDPEKLRDVGKL